MREDERTVEKSRGERISLVDIWGKSIPGRGISRCKGPEVEEGLMDFSKGGRSRRGWKTTVRTLAFILSEVGRRWRVLMENHD